MKWSEKVRDVRTRKGLTQNEFAAAGHVSEAIVRAIEAGTKPITVTVLENLLLGIGSSLAEFFESKVTIKYSDPVHQELHEKLQYILESDDKGAIDGIAMNVRYISAALRSGYRDSGGRPELQKAAVNSDIFTSAKTGSPLSEKRRRGKKDN